MLRNPRLTFRNADMVQNRRAQSRADRTGRTSDSDRTSALTALRKPDHSAVSAAARAVPAALGKRLSQLSPWAGTGHTARIASSTPSSPAHPVTRQSARGGRWACFVPYPTSPSLALRLPEISQQRTQKALVISPASWDGGLEGLWPSRGMEACYFVPHRPCANLLLPRVARETGPVSEEGLSRRNLEGPGKAQESQQTLRLQFFPLSFP